MDLQNRKEKYRKNVLILSYLTAFLAGYAFPLPGILSPQIAVSLGVKAENIVFIDGIFLIGLSVGSIAGGLILKKIYAGKSIVSAAFILALINIGFSIQENIFLYMILVFMNGFSLGVLIASVNYSIISNFRGKNNQSDSKLNIMQFFVGIGCFAGAATVGNIAAYLSWRYAFAAAAFFYFLIIISFLFFKSNLFLNISETESGTVKKEANIIQKSNRGLPIYIVMIGLALIAYVYTEYVVSYWFSPYLQIEKQMNVKIVGRLISIFWLTLAIGRLILGKFILPKISDFTFVIVLSITVIAGFIFFIFSNNIIMIFISIIILGIGCSAIFPTLLAFGMKLSEGLSTYVLSFLVMCGFFGGFLSLVCSAVLGAHLPKIIPIMTGPIWSVLIIIFFILAKKLKSKS